MSTDNNGWVSIKEKLPEWNKTVLWYFGNHQYMIDALMDGQDNEHLLGGYSSDVGMVFSPSIYWMPIPKPPQHIENQKTEPQY